MRCVAGARRRRINQRVRGSDARVGVSAGENVEFFSKKARRDGGAGSVCRQALRFWRRRGDARSVFQQ